MKLFYLFILCCYAENSEYGTYTTKHLESLIQTFSETKMYKRNSTIYSR